MFFFLLEIPSESDPLLMFDRLFGNSGVRWRFLHVVHIKVVFVHFLFIMVQPYDLSYSCTVLNFFLFHFLNPLFKALAYRFSTVLRTENMKNSQKSMSDLHSVQVWPVYSAFEAWKHCRNWKLNTLKFEKMYDLYSCLCNSAKNRTF